MHVNATSISRHAFRYRWLAQLWRVLLIRPPFAGFVFWMSIERERPALRLVNGGKADVPLLRVGRAL